MAINDFAGPIIQAFMQGTQLKRQTEQDKLAGEERLARIKQQEQEMNRMLKRDQLELQRMKMEAEDLVRRQFESGARKMGTEAMPLPGGVAAPKMSPVAQQLLGPSAVQELPLQQVPGQTAPMSLGAEFAIPETNAVQQPIVDLGQLGKIDLRNFRTPQEVMAQRLMEQEAALGLKVKETQAVEGVKSSFRKEEKAADNAAAMARTQVTAGVQKERNQALSEQAKATAEARKQDLELRRKALEQQQKIAQARLSIAYGKARRDAAKDATEIADEQAARVETVDAVRKGVLKKEDIPKLVPMSQRENFYKDLRKAGVVPMDEVQANATRKFQDALNFYRKMDKLKDVLNSSAIEGAWGTSGNDLAAELLADAEGFGRESKQMKGVLSDKDIERLKGALPSWTPGLDKTVRNQRRVNDLRETLKRNFNETFKTLPKAQRIQLAEETGMMELFEVKQ